MANWEVYDADALPNQPNMGKVLRRLCNDGINYQYLFFAIHQKQTDFLMSTFGLMGGWDTTNKAPTTDMRISTDHAVIKANITVSVSNLGMDYTSTSYYTGADQYGVLNTHGSSTRPSVPYRFLITESLTALWAEITLDASEFPMFISAEYTSADLWTNSASGVPPVVYGITGSNSQYMGAYAPFIRNTVGNVVPPHSCSLFTLAGSGGGFRDARGGLSRYTFDGNGNRVIPIIPIDVMLHSTNGDNFCYAGRMNDLYATMATLEVGDHFQMGTDTYVVIPTGAYGSSPTSYSPGGKLCAKVR